MARLIEIRCPPGAARWLAQAVRAFVARHYPYAADECSAAAREALLDLAQRFETELADAGACRYSQRIRAFVCEAVRTHCEALEQSEGVSYGRRLELYTAIVRGRAATGSDLAEAESVDLDRGTGAD